MPREPSTPSTPGSGPPPLPQREPSGRAQASGRRIVAIGSGKGGVGKSMLAANLGIFLAQLGKRTLLLDADLDGAGLHTHIGVERPARSLGDFWSGRVERLDECLVETQITGLALLSAAGDVPQAEGAAALARQRLCQGVRTLDADFVLIDLPPGASALTLDLFLLAHSAVLVAIPEPTAAEGAYRFLTAAFLHRLRGLPVGAALERLLQEGRSPAAEDLALHEPQPPLLPAPFDLLLAARASNPELARSIESEMIALRPRLVINQTRTRADLELGAQMRSAIRRCLGLPAEVLGHLDHDDGVIHSVRKRHPLVVEHPESKVTKNIERIARKLLADGAAQAQPTLLRRTEEQTLYEVLEVDPGASDEEIRRATRRMKETYAPDSLVLTGLCPPERVPVIQRRVEEAYDTLLDAERRRRYDLRLFPDGVPKEERRRLGSESGELKPTTDPKVSAAHSGGAPGVAAEPPQPPAPPPLPPPPITADTEFSGEILQRVRQALRLELKDIATRTKIGLSQLRAIEGESWDALPAQVYLRGFLQEYAKCLRLDSGQVVRSYLERYARARGEQIVADARRS